MKGRAGTKVDLETCSAAYHRLGTLMGVCKTAVSGIPSQCTARPLLAATLLYLKEEGEVLFVLPEINIFVVYVCSFCLGIF